MVLLIKCREILSRTPRCNLFPGSTTVQCHRHKFSTISPKFHTGMTIHSKGLDNTSTNLLYINQSTGLTYDEELQYQQARSVSENTIFTIHTIYSIGVNPCKLLVSLVRPNTSPIVKTNVSPKVNAIIRGHIDKLCETAQTVEDMEQIEEKLFGEKIFEEKDGLAFGRSTV